MTSLATTPPKHCSLIQALHWVADRREPVDEADFRALALDTPDARPARTSLLLALRQGKIKTSGKLGIVIRRALPDAAGIDGDDWTSDFDFVMEVKAALGPEDFQEEVARTVKSAFIIPPDAWTAARVDWSNSSLEIELEHAKRGTESLDFEKPDQLGVLDDWRLRCDDIIVPRQQLLSAFPRTDASQTARKVDWTAPPRGRPPTRPWQPALVELLVYAIEQPTALPSTRQEWIDLIADLEIWGGNPPNDTQITKALPEIFRNSRIIRRRKIN